MKKSLIALAVLGSLAGVSVAQSQATIYGIIDVGYGVGNGGGFEKVVGRDSKLQQWGNSRATSRWGIKGSEDLGNGMKVYFQLEQGLNPESGAGTGNGFDRIALVGVSGRFGSLQAGRQTTVINNVLTPFNLTGGPNLTSSLGNAALSSISQANGRTRSYDLSTGEVLPGTGKGGANYARYSSALTYISPDFSGFQFQAAFISKNDDFFGKHGNAGTPDPIFGYPRYINGKNVYTLGATYSIGNFKIGAAYESKFYDIPGEDISGSWGVAASYNFGSFLVSGGYFDNHFKSDGRGFHLGVKVPINSFEVGAQLAYNTSAYAGKENVWGFSSSGGSLVPTLGTQDREVKPLAWELFAKYKLSNRTTLYVQYGGINNDAKEFQAAMRKYSASFGITHMF